MPPPYVNVARVDLDTSPMLKSRFKSAVGQLPAVLLFRQTKMYQACAAKEVVVGNWCNQNRCRFMGRGCHAAHFSEKKGFQ